VWSILGIAGGKTRQSAENRGFAANQTALRSLREPISFDPHAIAQGERAGAAPMSVG
jgi:hypothetical protein